MKTFFQRLGASGALVAALFAATPSVFAAPPLAVSITAPANNATLGPLNSPNNAVTITASATPSGGAAFITSVDFRVNGVSVGVSTAAPFSTTWTPTAPGTYTLTAIATDSSAASNNTLTSAPSAVTVTAVRLSSMAAPASNTTIAQNSDVVLRASASMSDGVVGSVEFFLRDSLNVEYPQGAAVTSAPYFLVQTISIAPGAYNLFSRATVSGGGTTWESTATYPITVVAQVGAAPTINFVSPQGSDIIAVGSNVTVTVTATDTDGFIPNTAPGGVSFYADGELIATDLSAPYSVTWTPTLAKTVVLVAVTTDDKGNSRSTTRSVVVLASAPTVSISAPASNSNAIIGNAVTINATATAGVGTTITSVQFFADSTLIGTDSTTPFSVNWTPLALGSVALTARVTDSNSTVVTSATINVNVGSAAGTLSTTLTAPTNGTLVPLGSTAGLTANASAAGTATVARVDFLVGTTIVGTALSAPYQANWAPTAAGVFALTSKVTDSNGATATSPIVNVSVTAPNVTLATALAPGASGAVGSPLTLTATPAAVSPATVTRVDFYAGAALLGTANAFPYTFDWTPATNGTFSLTARVIDSNTATITSAAVSVSVGATPPTVVIVAPPNGATVALNLATSLSVNVAASPGATVTRVDYFLNGGTTPIGTSIAGPLYSVPWTPTVSGVASLTARVTDSTNATATSAAVLVTVAGASSGGLSASLALSGSTAIPGGSTRAVTVTGAGGTTVYAYAELYYDATLVGTDTSSPYNFLFTAPSTGGNHFLSARIVDSNGISATSASLPIFLTTASGIPPVAAVVTPASGSFVGVGTATTITGTASDGDGSISNVQVFVNGAVLGTATLSGSSWSITWTPTVTGVASLSAIATDNSFNTVATPAVGITVTDSLSPLISLALTPGAILNGIATLPSGATRNIVASVTPSAGRAVVRVEFFVDGTKIGEDTSLPYTFRYTAPALGAGEQSHTYVLSARATDNAGAARDVQQSLLVVAPIGQAPTVNLLTPSNNASAVPNSAVSIAAAATATGGGTIASVQFYVNGSPAAVNGGNPLTTAPYTTAFTPTVPATYTIDAIATDDRGNTAISSSANITAAFATPTIIFTAPNPNAVARATPGVPVPLAATVTVQGGIGAPVLLVEFLLDGVQIGADTTAPYAISWLPTTANLGTHVLTARVTDNSSQTATTAPLTINVANIVGSPPTVRVSASPIPALGLQTASTVNFIADAVATGTNVTLNSVEIFLNDVSIGLAARESSTNTYRLAYDLSRFDLNSVTPIINDITGAVTYPVRLYAIARDSANNQTVSATTNLVVNPATSSPPAVQLQALSPNNITAGTQFFIGATVSDPDGIVTLVQLYANGQQVTAIQNPQLGQLLTFTPFTAGTYNLYAVVTDDTGNTAVSRPSLVVSVTAVSAPATALSRPSDNATITTVNAPVFLEGTAVNTATTQVPTLQFIVTSSLGNRQGIQGFRVNQNSTSYRAIFSTNTADTYSISTLASVGIVQGTSPISRTVVVNSVQGLAPSISLTRSPGVSGFPGTATTASAADLTATATDPDGTIIGVEFFLDRNSIGQARRDPQGNTWRLTSTFAGLQPGNVEIVALARDNAGNVVATNTGNINVTVPSSIAPSIAITPSTVNPAFNRVVQLRANARDSDGTVTSVQYFANGVSIATSGNAGSLFLTNWTPSVSGLYNLYAVATDDSGNATVSPTIEITVRRNNPILENAAFILQTYQDIANTTNINPLVFDQLDEQLGNGTLTRADIIVSPLTANGGLPLTDLPGFQAPVNLLAAYYVLMGQWPTPQNYTNFLAIARNSLPAAIGNIFTANEYFAKYGFVPTTQILDSPTNANNAAAFLARLHVAAGLRPPEALDRLSFRDNNVLSATRGRGYAVVGLNQAIAEFITNTNSTNTALFDRARAAALFYQLTRPPVTVTVDDITARIDALLRLPSRTAIANAVLKDVYYGYRFVTITRHPQSLVVAPRSGALFNVEAQGAPPLSYQWLLNGAPIANATNAILSLTNVDASRAGTYTVAITSSAATATSDLATLVLSNNPARLVNISTRGVTTGAGANVLIGGFVVTGANANQTRQMLIRVVGPTLGNAPFNVAGALGNPRLEVYAGNNQTPVLTNDDWGSQTGGAAQVATIQQAIQRAGAFAFAGLNSNDAAVLATLPPGNYTVQAKAPVNNLGATGVVLIEVYDVTAGNVGGPKAANVSTRGQVGTGANVLIAGFVVNGATSRRILIRGAGPTLAGFGVPGVLADPQLSLVDQSTGAVIRTNDDWASGIDAGIIAQATTAAGAFPLANGSKDAAMIVMLAPGAYTVTLSGVNSGIGVGLVEVYDVDP